MSPSEYSGGVVVRRPFAVRARAYGRTIAMSATATIGESRLLLADAGLRIAYVLVLLAIWRSVVRPGQVVGGLDLATLLTYTVISTVFAQQLATKSELDLWLWEGMITNRQLYPMSLVGQLVAQLLGTWVFGFCAVSVPVLLLSPLLGVDPAPASGLAGLIFLPSLALSVAIGLAADVILGAMTVAYGLTVWLTDMLRGAVYGLLSGALLPLAILPWGLGRIFDWLPFASMASTPLRIYTGTAGWPSLLLQVGWAIGLGLLAAYLWNASRERLVGYGG